jgi:putative tricarboxylic transport membrane protein
VEFLIQGIHAALQPLTLLLTVAGVALGLVISAMPGLTVSMAVVLLLPFTFYLPSGPSLGLMLGVFVGGMAGGAISAILINIPGNPASVITNVDGYPMTKKGRADLALGIAFLSSILGGLFGLIVLVLVAPQLADFALLFGAPEQAMLVLLGLTLVAGFSEGALIRGLISAGIGLAIATVGLDPITASSRYTFGTVIFQQGISFIPVMIGMFAIPVAIQSLRQKDGEIPENNSVSVHSFVGIKEAFGKLKSLGVCILRSSMIGSIIGAIPGTGSAIAATISYQYAERLSRDRETPFGEGHPEGISAPEAANSALTGGALIPMLILGIPGDPVTAVMLGALIIQGLSPGPLLFQNSPEIVYGLFGSYGVALIVLSIVAVFGIPFFVRAVRIPVRILMSAIVLLCVIGSFALKNSVLDVWIMLFFGALAFYMQKWKYPILPMLLALILGKILEEQFRMSLIIGLGDPLIFMKKPISLTFMVLTVVYLVWTLRQEWRARRAVAAKFTKSTSGEGCYEKGPKNDSR